MMTTDSPQATEVKAALDQLMTQASSGRYDILESMYHDRMSTFLVDPELQLHRNDKAGFIEQVRRGTAADQDADVWARYHLVEADETAGHVIISRKVDLTGEQRRLITLSIDFVHEDGRWQVTREVIVVGGPA